MKPAVVARVRTSRDADAIVSRLSLAGVHAWVQSTEEGWEVAVATSDSSAALAAIDGTGDPAAFQRSPFGDGSPGVSVAWTAALGVAAMSVVVMVLAALGVPRPDVMWVIGLVVTFAAVERWWKRRIRRSTPDS